jgi:hypothetical protein
MRDVPPSRADRQLLLVTGSFLVVTAVLVAMVLYLATSQQDDTVKGPIFIGLEGPLKRNIREESPRYYINPAKEGKGFWLDIEDGELVALVLDRPGTTDCVVKWKEQQSGYVDCDGNVLRSENLDRYRLTVGPRGEGQPKNAVYVNLRRTTAAPEQLTGG